MEIINVNDFTQEIDCIYEGEQYSVRDNGAVFRHPRIGKRVRQNDNQWTFGKVNPSNPYLHLSDARIHRILATAFHGEPPNPQYVVDHIDTNCRNNRPENLRWVSRMDNVLLNPASRKKIIFRCGSVEAFIENPSILNTHKKSKQNFAWMRTVTPEEAQNCKEHISLWASTDKKPRRGSLGEWVYEPIKAWEIFGREPGLEVALTRRSTQNMWIGNYCYPWYPKKIATNPIETCFENLKVNAIFADNDDSPKLTILKFVRANNNSSILVMCEREGFRCEVEGFYPWSIFEIKLMNGLLFPNKLGSYFEKDDAEKNFILSKDKN